MVKQLQHNAVIVNVSVCSGGNSYADIHLLVALFVSLMSSREVKACSSVVKVTRQQATPRLKKITADKVQRAEVLREHLHPYVFACSD